jgi:hypothetical protein
MKDKEQGIHPDNAPQQKVDKFLGVLQRNERDGTTIPLELILPFDIDPELVLQLRKALDDYQVIAEA